MGRYTQGDGEKERWRVRYTDSCRAAQMEINIDREIKIKRHTERHSQRDGDTKRCRERQKTQRCRDRETKRPEERDSETLE
jgi:hypothetical protein